MNSDIPILLCNSIVDIAGAVKINSQISNEAEKLCIHILVGLDADTVNSIRRWFELARNASGIGFCGIAIQPHWTISPDDTHFPKGVDGFLSELEMTPPTGVLLPSLPVTVIIMESMLDYLITHRLKYLTRLVAVSEDVVCFTPAIYGLRQRGDDLELSHDRMEVEMESVIDNTLKSLDGCRKHLQHEYPNVSVVRLGGSLMGEEVEDVSVLRFWMAAYEYSRSNSLGRPLMGFAFHSKNDGLTAWWSPFYNNGSSDEEAMWLEVGECENFECGRRLVDLDVYSPGSNSGVNVTLLSSKVGGWRMIEIKNDMPVLKSTNVGASLAIGCQSHMPVRWVVEGDMVRCCINQLVKCR